MAIKTNKNFSTLDGGLFSPVTKADVGDGVGKLISQGYTIMSWADPFFPDPVLSDSVAKAMREALSDGRIMHYSMPIGLTEARTAVAERLQRKYGLKLDPARNILITPGSDSGLLYAMMSFLNEGDEVILFDPSYPSNFLNATMCGAKPVSVSLYEEDGFRFKEEELFSAWTPRTKAVVLTHPNNPTSTVMRKDQIETLCRFIVEKDLLLICDQAFEDHIYDGIEFVCPALIEGMWEHTLTVFSISKGYGLSGLRVGYIVGHEKLMNTLYGGTVNFLGATNTLAQYGAIAALNDEEVLERYTKIFDRRRQLAYQIFSDIPGVKVNMPESGILIWLNISQLGSGGEVADYILEHAKVSVNSGDFYGDINGKGHIRIVFSCYKDDSAAEKAYQDIAAALRQMGKEKGLA